MIDLSQEQQAIVDAPLAPLSVIACAGSGKTRTAVHRLVEISKRLYGHRGRVALLSFSNIAVNTFRQSYQTIVASLPPDISKTQVEISTMDAFITNNILRPHAYRTMGSKKAAYLLLGREPFLTNFKVKIGISTKGGKKIIPFNFTEMEAAIDNDIFHFYCSYFDKKHKINTNYALFLINQVGAHGAYTHNTGRYWCYKTLIEQPAILQALAQRYPHILIDEAQDISSLHKAILELLVNAGVQISLIGDPHQSIYEFAGADGFYLTEYKAKQNVAAYELTKNYRSVPDILSVANYLSSRTDKAERLAPKSHGGAFFIAYQPNEEKKLVSEFYDTLIAVALKPDNSAVLCRGSDLVNELKGKSRKIGQGVVKNFAKAAVLRDKDQNYQDAFKEVVSSVISLLDEPPKDLITKIIHPSQYPELRALRRIIWNFTRDVQEGLPSSDLIAVSEWQPQLKKNVEKLLANLKADFGLPITTNFKKKITKRDLPKDTSLLLADEKPLIRIDTVHKVKGESLDAVLYITKKEQVEQMLAGVATEVGRIGYVAITRAKNLFWLGVPAKVINELKPWLLAAGFREAEKSYSYT